MQLHKLLFATALLILLATSQVTSLLLAGPTATLTGRVTDPSGAVMAGVKVEATNVETNVTYPGETNEQGLYNIPNLRPGIYRVMVQKSAFQTIVKPDVEMHVQDVIALNFSMEMGSEAESITVEAGAPLIQTDPQRGGDFVSREVRDLPLAGLNPVSLARTLPGAIVTAGSSTIGPLESAFSVNGQRPYRANNFLLDSTDNNDFAWTGIAQPFNIADAVEEVVVQTGNFGVEFGRAGGGVFNVVTKSGTNSLHGTLLWRYQTQRFNSVSNLDRGTWCPGLVSVKTCMASPWEGRFARTRPSCSEPFSRTRGDPILLHLSFLRRQRSRDCALYFPRTRDWISIWVFWEACVGRLARSPYCLATIRLPV